MADQRTGYVCIKPNVSLELLQLWAPRCPMAQLSDEYRVSDTNKKPIVVYFAIPIDAVVITEYAIKHNCIYSNSHLPSIVKALDHLSECVQYDLDLCWPFKATADCGLILILYDNYTMDDKMLIDEDQEDVIRMVQEELGLDKSMRPKWYFDWEDPWRPEYPTQPMVWDEGEDEGERRP